jgi:hypothetical protein
MFIKIIYAGDEQGKRLELLSMHPSGRESLLNFAQRRE